MHVMHDLHTYEYIPFVKGASWNSVLPSVKCNYGWDDAQRSLGILDWLEYFASTSQFTSTIVLARSCLLPNATLPFNNNWITFHLPWSLGPPLRLDDCSSDYSCWMANVRVHVTTLNSLGMDVTYCHFLTTIVPSSFAVLRLPQGH